LSVSIDDGEGEFSRIFYYPSSVLQYSSLVSTKAQTPATNLVSLTYVGLLQELTTWLPQWW